MTEIHFVQVDTIIRNKRVSYWLERDPDDMGRAVTISDIRAGQIENVRKVYCADLEARTFHDVSEDIAQAVADELDHAPLGSLKDFLEEHLGVGAVANIERELEGA